MTAQAKRTVHVVFEQVEDGGWYVSSPDMPDGSALVAGDEDFDEARKLAHEAVAFTLEGLGLEAAAVDIVDVLPDQRKAL
jgi:predicted RNase H-like HicB family nuclease